MYTPYIVLKFKGHQRLHRPLRSSDIAFHSSEPPSVAASVSSYWSLL